MAESLLKLFSLSHYIAYLCLLLEILQAFHSKNGFVIHLILITSRKIENYIIDTKGSLILDQNDPFSIFHTFLLGLVAVIPCILKLCNCIGSCILYSIERCL